MAKKPKARAKKAPTKAKKASAKAKKAPAKPKAKKKAPAKAQPKQTVAAKPAGSVAPFTIDDIAGRGVRLSFFDWSWLEKQHGSIEVDGYYMNGPGVEGLVQAVMFANKIESDDIEGDSEGDACLLYFPNVALATRVGELAAAMIKDRAQLAKTITIAREEGFED
jgi:hypothetical protein